MLVALGVAPQVGGMMLMSTMALLSLGANLADAMLQLAVAGQEATGRGSHVGVALVAADDEDRGNGTIQRADAALYDARRAGRDRVVLWLPPPAGT